MEVDREPSPWPCLAMLIGLLLMCLLAPSYWRSKDSEFPGELTQQYAPAPQPPARQFSFAQGTNKPFRMPLSGMPNYNDPLHLWSPPTLDELVAARIGLPRIQEPILGWPVNGSRTSASGGQHGPTTIDTSAIDPTLAAVLQTASPLLTGRFPLDQLPQLTARVADGLKKLPLQYFWPPHESSNESSLSASSTLRMISPQDRYAMHLPLVDDNSVEQDAATESEGAAPPPVELDPWCVPQMLYDQLNRLARHPESAIWARHTIAQLHSLVRRDQLQGKDVRTLLAEIGDSANTAARLAADTSDEKLRVELLRAYWALARRLDCWAALHDVRVATIANERLAARESESIGSFFQGPPQLARANHCEAKLTKDLEAYERSRDPELARQVTQQQRTLEVSQNSFDRSVAGAVEQHYRNANVRVALTAEFLNRLVGQQRSEIRPLRERIAGTPVRGRSIVRSESRVRLTPATDRWLVTVEADGVVDSNTLADGGRAQLRSQSATDFSASKSVSVDRDGVHLARTEANASTRNRLTGVTTDFDWVPFVGSYARDRAQAEYRARRGRAAAQIEFKVSEQAVDLVDRETLDAVERVENSLRERFTDRLAEAGVDLTPIEMKTTEERLVARLRVAGEHQLGSHTPRPRALSDSLASVQIHETALTNAAVSLDLDGKRYNAQELHELFREKFPSLKMSEAESRHDTVFHFADENALRFLISDGKLEITVALRSVEQDGRTMRGAIIHAYYEPVVNGLQAELARSGSLGIEGRLSSGDRARLHNVFNSVLPEERRLPIVRLENPADARLEGLMITQLVLEDGWLGLAIGPTFGQRVAERSRSLR
jgi:hypothetical protein